MTDEEWKEWEVQRKEKQKSFMIDMVKTTLLSIFPETMNNEKLIKETATDFAQTILEMQGNFPSSEHLQRVTKKITYQHLIKYYELKLIELFPTKTEE